MPILSYYSPTTGVVELTALDPFTPNDVTELISKAKSSDVAVSRPKVLFNFLLSDLTKFEVSEIRQLIIRRGSLLPFQRNERIAFVAKNFVICSFVERPLEDEKHKVLKVPFYHSNIDFDEQTNSKHNNGIRF